MHIPFCALSLSFSLSLTLFEALSTCKVFGVCPAFILFFPSHCSTERVIVCATFTRTNEPERTRGSAAQKRRKYVVWRAPIPAWRGFQWRVLLNPVPAHNGTHWSTCTGVRGKVHIPRCPGPAIAFPSTAPYLRSSILLLLLRRSTGKYIGPGQLLSLCERFLLRPCRANWSLKIVERRRAVRTGRAEGGRVWKGKGHLKICFGQKVLIFAWKFYLRFVSPTSRSGFPISAISKHWFVSWCFTYVSPPRHHNERLGTGLGVGVRAVRHKFQVNIMN